jgi:MarR family transcriptional regulator, organic hydroperoxide resistance regulator
MSAPSAPRAAAEPGALPLSQLIDQVAHELARRVEHALGPDGPTLDQWRVLTLLADGAGHPMTEIAAHAMVPAPTLTKIVDRLVDRALVYRRADAVDRRRVLVFLSEHGRALHARLAPAAGRVDRSIAGALAASDEARLRELLELVRALPVDP